MTDMELADILANCSFHTDAGSPAIYRKVPEVIAGRIIAALRRGHERPPSGEMVMGLRVVVNPSVPADEVWITDAHGKRLGTIVNLAAAEAEGRKSCPLCGRTDPHSHTSGPLGIS